MVERAVSDDVAVVDAKVLGKCGFEISGAGEAVTTSKKWRSPPSRGIGFLR